MINRLFQTPQTAFKVAVFLSLVIHLCLLIIYAPSSIKPPKNHEETLVVIQLDELEKKESTPPQTKKTLSDKTPATQLAPNAPTAEEWAFAAKYTLKNSKGYRHSWGQQVRSMMGTAVEGPDQGAVRFRIEIAPNGTLTKLETLWATSDVAEMLARKAIMSMPPPPPTPTGKPLIFERTITFSPFASDDTPFYRDDCLPDPPSFQNPFAWDGKSPQEVRKNQVAEKLNPEALAECLKQLPKDSIEGENAHNQRLTEQWGSKK